MTSLVTLEYYLQSEKKQCVFHQVFGNVHKNGTRGINTVAHKEHSHLRWQRTGGPERGREEREGGREEGRKGEGEGRGRERGINTVAH